MVNNAIAGFVYGMIEKSVGDKMPSFPVIGKAGTIALACHYVGGGNKMLRQAGEFAAGLAGYQLGKDGKVLEGEMML